MRTRRGSSRLMVNGPPGRAHTPGRKCRDGTKFDTELVYCIRTPRDCRNKISRFRMVSKPFRIVHAAALSAKRHASTNSPPAAATADAGLAVCVSASGRGSGEQGSNAQAGHRWAYLLRQTARGHRHRQGGIRFHAERPLGNAPGYPIEAAMQATTRRTDRRALDEDAHSLRNFAGASAEILDRDGDVIRAKRGCSPANARTIVEATPRNTARGRLRRGSLTLLGTETPSIRRDGRRGA